MVFKPPPGALLEAMMDCEQARQLFDAYLDGELSAALATELGAHRVRCAQCRRALALLEVGGQIIASDRDAVSVRGDFADRLLACMEAPSVRWTRRFRRAVYIAGPLAAAAVIALAFLGVFDSRNAKVAGAKIERTDAGAARPLPDSLAEEGLPDEGDHEEDLLKEWLQRTQENMAAKRQSGESLQSFFDLTILQLLDTLEKAQDASPGEEHVPGSDAPVPATASEAAPTKSDDVEDL